MRTRAWTVILLLGMTTIAMAQESWLRDLETAARRAEESRRPIFLVLRCVP